MGHGVVYDVEAESGPTTVSLCCIKWFKYFFQTFRLNASPIVGQSQCQGVTIDVAADKNAAFFVFFKGMIERIHEEIRDDLHESTGVAVHGDIWTRVHNGVGRPLEVGAQAQEDFIHIRLELECPGEFGRLIRSHLLEALDEFCSPIEIR